MPSEAVNPLVVRRTLGIVGWILGFFVSIWLLGFSITVPLCTFPLPQGRGREKWFISVLLTLVAWRDSISSSSTR